MAKRTQPPAAQGFLVIEAAGCRTADAVAHGTREQLLAAGLCTPAHFPPGLKRVACGHDHQGRWWCLEKTGGWWKLQWNDTNEEREEARLAVQVASQQKSVAAALRARVEAGPDAWRAECLNCACVALSLVRAKMAGGDEAFAVRDADLLAFDAIARRVHLLFANAGIKPLAGLDSQQSAELPTPRGPRAPLRMACRGDARKDDR